MESGMDMPQKLPKPYLDNPVQGNEGARPPDTGRAVDYDWSHLRADPLTIRPNEADERLRWLGHPEVGPRCEVKVLDLAHGVATHNPELGDVPIGEVGLIQDLYLPNITWVSIGDKKFLSLLVKVPSALVN